MEASILGNALYIWLAAIATAVVLFGLLSLLKRLIGNRLDKIARATPLLLDDLAVDLTLGTKRYFLFAIALYAASFLLVLAPPQRHVVNQIFILICLAQTANWGSIAIGFWVENSLKKRAVVDSAAATSIGLITFLAKFLLFVMVALLAVHNLGFNITTLIAGLGVGGIAVALAVQKILGDLFASLTIVLDKPFVVGDFVVVGEFMGTIETIGLKTTRIRSLSGEQLIFPNSDLLESRLRNYKRMTERRIVFTTAVTFQTPPETLERIPGMIREALEKHSLVRVDRCHFLRFGASWFEFETVYWVKHPDFAVYAEIAHQVNLDIVKRFRQESITLAYPTQRLFVENQK